MFCSPRVPAEFLGWTPQQLQAELTGLQQAISQVSRGANPESVSYTQGQGGRSVTFNKADLGYLQQRLQAVAALLNPGAGYGRRRPPRIVYR